MGYNVVLEGTGAEGSNFEGIRTWTDYQSKAAFDRVRARVKDKLIAEGVSDDQAIKLVSMTPGETRARLAIKQSREFPEMALRYLKNQLLAAIHDGTELDYLATLSQEAEDLYEIV